MLPDTARREDIVEVINKESKHYDSIGLLKNVYKDGNRWKAEINIDGKIVTFFRSELSMKARQGTIAYRKLLTMIMERKIENLAKADYDELINIAIDNKDWDWAEDLVHRKNELVKNR